MREIRCTLIGQDVLDSCSDAELIELIEYTLLRLQEQNAEKNDKEMRKND